MIKKEPRVLIVARFEESTKRLIKALNIWNQIQTRYNQTAWHLDIVDDGPDKGLYLGYVERKRIRNVTFGGQQDPTEYYKRSSILMLTSCTECFPLVVTESMQYGCVPILFDSFEACRDLVSDGLDGIIVPKNNTKMYIKKLNDLIRDEEKRTNMSNMASESVQRYSVRNIVEEWNSLFDAIKQNN